MDNLLGDRIVIIPVVCFLQELLLQFHQLAVNVIREGTGVVADDRGDIFSQHFHVAAFVQNHLVDGLRDNVL